jgi:hypothetical protein
MSYSKELVNSEFESEKDSCDYVHSTKLSQGNTFLVKWATAKRLLTANLRARRSHVTTFTLRNHFEENEKNHETVTIIIKYYVILISVCHLVLEFQLGLFEDIQQESRTQLSISHACYTSSSSPPNIYKVYSLYANLTIPEVSVATFPRTNRQSPKHDAP